MLGKLEGYQIKTIFKYMAKKEGFGLAESSALQKEEQQRIVLEALKSKGNVFGIYKKCELQACYVFERTTMMEDEISYPKYDLNKDNAWDFVTGHDVEEAFESEENVEVTPEKEGVLKDIIDDMEEMGKELEDELNESMDLLFDKKKENKQASKPVAVIRLKAVYNHSVPEDILEEFEKAILKEFKELLMLNDVKAIFWNEKMLVQKQVKVGTMGYVNALPMGLGVGVAIGVALDNIALGMCLGMLWGLAFGTIFTSAGKN